MSSLFDIFLWFIVFPGCYRDRSRPEPFNCWPLCEIVCIQSLRMPQHPFSRNIHWRGGRRERVLSCVVYVQPWFNNAMRLLMRVNGSTVNIRRIERIWRVDRVKNKMNECNALAHPFFLFSTTNTTLNQYRIKDDYIWSSEIPYFYALELLLWICNNRISWASFTASYIQSVR